MLRPADESGQLEGQFGGVARQSNSARRSCTGAADRGRAGLEVEDPTWDRLESQIGWYDRNSGDNVVVVAASPGCNDPNGTTGADGR
jgi:hypothetical protein